MQKKCILFLMFLFLLSGCENKEEKLKKEYIDIKSNLLESDGYVSASELPFDITVNVDRIDKENIKYKVTFCHAKENMKEISAMVIHNAYDENLYPSIGVFDGKKDLFANNDSNIQLEGMIESIEDISELDLSFNIWISYKNDLNEYREIFYKTTQI